MLNTMECQRRMSRWNMFHTHPNGGTSKPSLVASLRCLVADILSSSRLSIEHGKRLVKISLERVVIAYLSLVMLIIAVEFLLLIVRH